jgi:hypothetical protein
MARSISSGSADVDQAQFRPERQCRSLSWRRTGRLPGWVGSRRTVARVTRGAISLSNTNAALFRARPYAHRFAAAAEIASSVRAMPISYEVISGLPIRPSSLLASYAIGFT